MDMFVALAVPAVVVVNIYGSIPGYDRKNWTRLYVLAQLVGFLDDHCRSNEIV